MWVNYHRRAVIINCILGVLLVAALVVLRYKIMEVNRVNQEQDAHLAEIYQQQQQEQTEARQETMLAIQEAYEQDMQTVQEYLPGVVCWGDSLTFGSAGTLSFPGVLKSCMNTYISDQYDFRATLDNVEGFSRIKWDDYTVDIPVVNMGGGEESTWTVLGRAGASNYVLGADVVVPAEPEPVLLQLRSQNGDYVLPLMNGDIGVNDVTLGGVTGKLTIDTSAFYYGGYRYYFTRSEAGAEERFPAGTELITASASQYRDYIHIVWIGTYGGFNDAEDLVRQVKTLLSRQAKNPERYLVIGLCSVHGSATDTYYMDAIDTAMMQAFGSRYINARLYFCSDGMADAGTPITGWDYYTSNKIIPPAFTTTPAGVTLNGLAFSLLGELAYKRMESLGYFDEIYSELGIKPSSYTSSAAAAAGSSAA